MELKNSLFFSLLQAIFLHQLQVAYLQNQVSLKQGNRCTAWNPCHNKWTAIFTKQIQGIVTLHWLKNPRKNDFTSWAAAIFKETVVSPAGHHIETKTTDARRFSQAADRFNSLYRQRPQGQSLKPGEMDLITWFLRSICLTRQSFARWFICVPSQGVVTI